jgi:hypothetical protein
VHAQQPPLPADAVVFELGEIVGDVVDQLEASLAGHLGEGVAGGLASRWRLRVSADRGCPVERFQRLLGELGEAFVAIEVDSSPGSSYRIPSRAHAVLTVDLVDEPGHPTRAAAQDPVLGFLDQRLPL